MIRPSSYALLAVDQATMAAITGTFGVSANTTQLETVFGPTWSHKLFKYQRTSAPGDSCIYYLDSANRDQQVYALCFDKTKLLVSKATISASVSNPA